MKQLQKEMFREAHFPKLALEPQSAHFEFIRGSTDLVPLEEAAGRVAVEGALPYPPGVLCVVPGEVWGGSVLKYFLALEEGINRFPGFSPELQGVYINTDVDGRKRLRLRARQGSRSRARGRLRRVERGQGFFKRLLTVAVSRRDVKRSVSLRQLLKRKRSFHTPLFCGNSKDISLCLIHLTTENDYQL